MPSVLFQSQYKPKIRPGEETARWMNLSPSRSNDFKHCEEKLHKAKFQFFENVLALAERQGYLLVSDILKLAGKKYPFFRRSTFNGIFPMILGKALHLVFCKFFDAVKIQDIPADGNVFEMIYQSTVHLCPPKFLPVMEHHCRNFAIIESARWERLRKFSHGDIKLQFHYWKPIIVEHERIDNELGIDVIIDRIEIVPPGYFAKDPSPEAEYCIVDYKTGKSKEMLTTDNRRQLFFYSTYFPPEKIRKQPRYGSIIYTDEPIRLNTSFFPQTAAAFRRLMDEIENAVTNHHWKRSLSRRWACKWCDKYLDCWLELGFEAIYKIKEERRKEKEATGYET